MPFYENTDFPYVPNAMHHCSILIAIMKNNETHFQF